MIKFSQRKTVVLQKNKRTIFNVDCPRMLDNDMVVVDINPDYEDSEECDEQEEGTSKKQEAGRSKQRSDDKTDDSSDYDNWRWREDG